MARNAIAFAAALGCAVIVYGAPGRHAGAQEDFRTQMKVDLGKFAGRWHELARTPTWFMDPEREGGKLYSECYNVQARYTKIAPDKLRIENICYRRSAGGDVIRESITGVATVERGTENRKLEIALGGEVTRDIQRFLMGGRDYWIYCTGPVNESGRYEWAVVGGSDKEPFFLLAREQSVPEQARAEMLSCARREGLPVNRLMYRQ